MMKSKFQFYKNIILVVASALTLVAVTFAWFSSPATNDVSSIDGRVGTDLINVYFYESDGKGGYKPLTGDIDLGGMVSGEYKQYKFIIRTNSKDAMKLNFSIDGLDEVSQEFKEAVSIKHTLKTAKRTEKNGTVTYTDGTQIDSSVGINGYVSLSSLGDTGLICSPNLEQYQTEKGNYFVMYYEIGLSESAGASVQGKASSLGTVKLSAQLVG